MAIELVCIEPFHGVKRGEVITDPERVATLTATHPHAFVKRMAPDPPAPVEPPVPIDPPT